MGPDDHIKADPPTYPVGQVCQHGTLARKCDECYANWQLLELCKVIAAQAATIELLRAECRAWREDNRMWIDDDYDTVREYSVDACIAATDAAKALEEP